MKKVLIVDDDMGFHKALEPSVAKAGLEVLSAENGKEGLKLALQEHPDLILLDIIMPEMDGLTTLNFLREDTWGKDVKVILLTNLPELGKMKAEFEQKKVYSYVTKAETSVEELVRIILKAL